MSAVSEQDPNQKGKLLEELVENLLGSVAGLRVMPRRVKTRTEEIDLVVGIHRIDPYWAAQGAYFLVECKNWSSKVGKNDIVSLLEKIRNRRGRCRLAFLIAPGGFAKTAKEELLRGSRDDALIVTVVKKDLEGLIASKNVEVSLRGLIDRAVLE